MLPTAFLRQLIGFYGGGLQDVVPRYLETAMTSFARQQQQLRQAVQQTFSPFLPAGVEELSRQNMAAIERTMSMFNPFHRGSAPLPPAPGATAEGLTPAPAIEADPADRAELGRLRQEVESLRAQLAAAVEVAPSNVPDQDAVTELAHTSEGTEAPADAPPARRSSRRRSPQD